MMDKWERLKKEISNWQKDAQTDEENMVLKIILEKMEYIENNN